MSAVRVRPTEWRWVWAWSLLVVALTIVPYLSAAAQAPVGYTFGGFLVNARDGNSYLAKMRQGYAGEWLFRLPFTPEDQTGIFVFTYHLGLGHLARLTGLPLIVVYHAARAVGGLALLLTLYRLAAELTDDVAARRWAYGLGAFGSGLGFYALLAGRDTSVDLWVPEANTFYSILGNAHFSLSFTLAIWSLLLLFGAGPGWRRGPGIALVGLALVMVTPIMAPVVWAAVAGGLLALWINTRSFPQRAFGRAALLIVPMGAVLVYEWLVSVLDPTVAGWSAQNITPSPPVVDYVLGFGILLPLAAGGVWLLWRGAAPRGLAGALIWWMGAVALLVYLPVPLQRRFVSGVHVPLALCAGIGLAALLAGAQRWQRLGAVFAVCLLAGPTNLLLYAAVFQAPAQVEPFSYLTEGELAALHWLEANTDRNSVVLASPELGNFIPAHSRARVVYGHPMETVGAAEKEAQVTAYYQGQLDRQQVAGFFDRYRVTHVVFGPRERGLASAAPPWMPPTANQAYAGGGVNIFELARP